MGGGLAHLDVLQRGNQALAVGGAGLPGNVGVAFGKPFNFLQLDAVPRRVANHGVKTVAGARTENRRKAGPPVKKGFAGSQCAGAGHQVIGRLCGGVAAFKPACAEKCDKVLSRLQQFEQSDVFGVLSGGDLRLKCLPVFGEFEQLMQFGNLVHRPAGHQPAHGAPEVEHGVNRRDLRCGLLREFFGQLRLGNVHIGQVSHLGNVAGRQRQPVKLGLQQQRAQILQAALHIGQLFPMQAVANFEVMVQKAQRCADGEGVQPQGGFGQFNGHGVFVHAEDALLQNHAAHDVPVIELGIGHGPAPVFGGGFDAATNVRNARQHRALPRAAGFHQMRGPGLNAHQVGGGGDGFQHAVGQVIDQRHQKMAAAHGRVANFEFQNLAGRVFGVQRIPVAGVERAFFGAFFQVQRKSVQPFAGQQADRLAQNQPHQIIMRVVAARDLARKTGGRGDDAVDLGLVFVVVLGLHFMHQAVFEQPLVNAAQVRHGQVAVVDPAMQQVFGAARQRVNDGGHDGIRHIRALQQRRAGAVEQAAVVGGHANIVVARIDKAKQASQRQPDRLHGAGKPRPRIHLVAHVFPQAAHAVRRIARIAHRQQITVFGVKQKQQAIQQHQCGFAHFVQILRGELRAFELAVTDFMRFGVQVATRQRICQLRKNVAKNAYSQVLRHFFFVQAGFVEGVGVKGAASVVPALRQEGRTLKKQKKQTQRMARFCFFKLVLNAGQPKGGGHVHFKKLFGARAGVLPVQAPHRAVGQHAPFHGAV